jgi:hypothetical protein
MAINKESKGFGMPWEDEYGHTFSGGAIRRWCDVRHSSLNSEAERQTMHSNQLVATENRSSAYRRALSVAPVCRVGAFEERSHQPGEPVASRGLT